jgi:uncharacterized protein involved in exopolysaccharide biosynthesis
MTSRLLVPLLLVLGAGGCRKPPPPPTAQGALVFQPQALRPAGAAPSDPRVFLATQAEILKSRHLAERVAERLRLSPGDRSAPPRLTVTPRGDALILDVRAHHPDPSLSAQVCNTTVDEYLTGRWDQAREPLHRRQLALAERLDALGEDGDPAKVEALRRELQHLAMELTAVPSDAHVLEPCRPLTR